MKPDYTYHAKYASNYDGDTVRLDVSLGFGVWLHDQIFRLYGIDTPELRGAEKEEGIIARDFVMEALLEPAEIVVRTYKDAKGKYGRWLAEIYYRRGDQWTNLNEELIEKGLAKRYVC